MILAITIPTVATTILLPLIIRKMYKNERERIENALISFISPTGSKDNPQPSELAQWIDSISAIFIQRAETRIKAQTMQAQGAVKRQENALMGEIIEGAVAAKSPLLGLLMQFAPDAAKKLKKSPAMAQAVLGVADMLGAGGSGAAPGNGSAPSNLADLYK